MLSMDNNFNQSMHFILKWECGLDRNGQIRQDGGYNNNPKDSGGETKFGISKKYHPELDIPNLTVEEALSIYYNDYWKKAGCQFLEQPLASCVMNSAVMSGVKRAIGILEDTKDWKEYLNNYKIFLFNLNRPDFIKGWMRRIKDLQLFCIIWEQDHPEDKKPQIY
jgi:hypothetical protein